MSEWALGMGMWMSKGGEQEHWTEMIGQLLWGKPRPNLTGLQCYRRRRSVAVLQYDPQLPWWIHPSLEIRSPYTSGCCVGSHSRRAISTSSSFRYRCSSRQCTPTQRTSNATYCCRCFGNFRFIHHAVRTAATTLGRVSLAQRWGSGNGCSRMLGMQEPNSCRDRTSELVRRWKKWVSGWVWRYYSAVIELHLAL